MSGNGRLRAELEARRREEIRLQQVREQCTNLLNLCENKLRADAIIAAFLKDEIGLFNENMNDTRSLVSSDPDQALLTTKEISEQLNSAISKAVAKKQAWEEKRQFADQRALNAQDFIASIPASSPKAKEHLQELSDQLKMLRDSASPADQLLKFVEEIEAKTEEIKIEEEKEIIRKELVKNIILALKSQGFLITKPKLKDDVVLLTGKLPSGRKAIFQIYQDATIAFDFDGYSGTTCKTELDGILEKMKTESGVKTTIEQFVWHNPDKIKKGAKEFPAGTGQKRYMKR